MLLIDSGPIFDQKSQGVLIWHILLQKCETAALVLAFACKGSGVEDDGSLRKIIYLLFLVNCVQKTFKITSISKGK